MKEYIKQVLREGTLLTEDFKTQKQRYIQQGIDPEIVNDYILKFKHIKDKKFKEMFDTALEISVPPEKRNDIDAYKDFHELEQLVDYVSGLKQGVSSISSTSKEDIEVDGKPVYKDENFEVYYADTPRACIKYKGKFPYSWCIARSDSSNMFYTYRFKPYEPAFYFIKDLKATEKEFGIWNMTKNVFKGTFKNKYHFFVLQVPKNAKMDDDTTDQYIVSSANNDGDTQMSWEDILKINPRLAPIREVLQPKPFTEGERDKNNRFKNGISDEDFARLSYEDKRSYLDIYPTIARPITYRQLKALPEDLLNLYVSFGIGLKDDQFEYIKQKKDILKRYTQISRRKLEEYLKRDKYDRRQLKMMYSELIVLSDKEITSYLESLDQKDINDFVVNNENGEQKFDFLEKHLPDKFTNEGKSLRELLLNANKGDEQAIDEINNMVPNDIPVSFYNNTITFDLRMHKRDVNSKIDEDVKSVYEVLDYNSLNNYGYSDSYFEGDNESLQETYEQYLEDFIKNNPAMEDNFKAFGITFDVDTVKDLLDTYKESEDVLGDIDREFTSAKEEGEEKAFKEMTSDIKKIIYYDPDVGEVDIKLNPFMMYLTKHAFFTTDITDFLDNIIILLNDILQGYDVAYEYHRMWEQINEAGYNNMVVDDESIYNSISSSVDNALDKFADAHAEDSEEDNQDTNNNEEGKVARLKSQIINSLNNTLKALGKEPLASEIENELVKIKIDRQKFHMDGKVFISMLNKKTNETNSGYVYIKDIPNYFQNHKLFEFIAKFNKIIKYLND